MPVEVELAATLPALTVAISAGFAEEITVAATLPALTIACEIEPIDATLVDIAATLPTLTVAATIASPTIDAEIACTLPRLTIKALIQGPAKLSVAFGKKGIHAGGNGLLVIQGLPNRSIAWSLVSGSGTLTPLSAATDANGVAYCRYIPGTYTGSAVVKATYVP